MDIENTLESVIISPLDEADSVNKGTDGERMRKAIEDINNFLNTTKNELHQISRPNPKSTSTPTQLLTPTIATTIHDIKSAHSQYETIDKSIKRRINHRRKRGMSIWRGWITKCTTATPAPRARPRKTNKSIYITRTNPNKTTEQHQTEATNNTDITKSIYLDVNASATPSYVYKYKEQIDNTKQNIYSMYRGKEIRPHITVFAREATKMARRYAISGHKIYNRNDRKMGGDRPKRFKILDRDGMRHKDLRRIEPLEISKADTSMTDEERKLKVNIEDALFHEQGAFLRNGKIEDPDVDVRKMFLEDSSLTDEEPVLKSRIYQVFGYGDTFANISRQQKRDDA